MVSLDREIHYTFKLVITGDSGVGKTSLLSRFTKNQFNLEIRSTMGFNSDYKIIEIEGKSVRGEIWDTPGQDRLRPIVVSFYRGAVGAMLVFDITNKDSFYDLKKWIREIKSYGDSIHATLLIGNKSDRDEFRTVSQNEAMLFAQKNNLIYIETSASTAENVDRAFELILTEVLHSSKRKMSGIEVASFNGPTKKIESSERSSRGKSIHGETNCRCISF